MINNEIYKTEKDILNMMKNLIKRVVRKENKMFSAIYELDKIEYLKMKRKYKMKVNNIFIQCYTVKIDNKICFVMPDLSNINLSLTKYTNLTLKTAVFNSKLGKEKLFIKRGLNLKDELLRAEKNPASMLPPYYDFVYICRSNGKVFSREADNKILAS